VVERLFLQKRMMMSLLLRNGLPGYKWTAESLTRMLPMPETSLSPGVRQQTIWKRNFLSRIIVTTINLNTMAFIVIECHGGPQYAIICIDQEGNNLVFETEYEAQVEADNCQDGRVVELQ
jgi:hypothetical protein